MTAIDLVTGFLGAGKTTFIARYGQWLRQQGIRFAVVENEFGAAGVDSAVLREQFGVVRELSGGCICCTLKSGFYQLLEELCSSCDRIIVEPSGLYNLDDFFEVTDGLERAGLARPGMCITLVDPHSPAKMNAAERDILRDELLGSGGVVWTKADVPPAWDEAAARAQVTACMGDCSLPMQFYPRSAHLLEDKDFLRLQAMTPVRRSHVRVLRDHRTFYQSTSLRPAAVYDAATLPVLLRSLITDGSCGEILRIKGFVNTPDGTVAVNGTVSDCTLQPCAPRPAMLNIIGRRLDRKHLKEVLDAAGAAAQTENSIL